MRGLRDRVTRTLTDATRNNPLVYYRDSRTTRFTLPPYGSEAITNLIAGARLRRADLGSPATAGGALFGDAAEAGRDETVQPSAEAAVRARRRGAAGPVDPWTHRLRAMRDKAKENEQERGLKTLYAAICMVTWAAADGGRPPMAPLFLVPVAIETDERAPDDYTVSRVPDGEVVINRALLTVAPAAFGDAARALFEGGVVDDIARGWHDLKNATQSLSTVEMLPTSALGIFNFSMMAIVEDINEAQDALANHLVIRALAGDIEAQGILAAARDGAVDVTTLDAIPPIDEPFVLDADPWQERTIQTLLKYPDSNAVCQGPPGTGKSQTIANLIAALIAQGKTVLFACEKRAALEVVKRRLSAVGLEALMLDMHGAAITRQYAYAQLKGASATIRAALPASDRADGPLETTRANLNAHVRFMHTPLDGVDLRPFALLGEIAMLPALDLGTRIDPARLGTLNALRLEELTAATGEAARSAAAFLRQPDVPWASAPTTDANRVPAALDTVGAASGVLTMLRGALGQIGIVAKTRAEFASAIAMLAQVRAALTCCTPSVVELDVATLDVAASTLRSPFGGLLTFFSGPRRAAMRALAPHLRGAARERTAAALAPRSRASRALGARISARLRRWLPPSMTPGRVPQRRRPPHKRCSVRRCPTISTTR